MWKSMHKSMWISMRKSMCTKDVTRMAQGWWKKGLKIKSTKIADAGGEGEGKEEEGEEF